MGEVQWIRLYIDMFDKRKIKKLRRLPAGNELLLIWVMLLATAGKCNAGGMIYITEDVPFTEEDLADELGFEVSTIKLALNAFAELGMITSEDGFISVANWEEYQNTDRLAEIREQTRKRVAKHREKKLLAQSSVTSNVTVPLGNALEEEIEEDKEKEEEFHSFVLSDPEMTEEARERIKLKYMGGTLGQNKVLISDEQFSDLCDKLSIDEIEKYFGIIVDCETKGKCFRKKTHYQAILDMARKDRKLT